jgi:hypothetical protein
MSTTTVIEPGGPTPGVAPERISLFQRTADRVSYGMGTPLNIFHLDMHRCRLDADFRSPPSERKRHLPAQVVHRDSL